MNLAEKFHQFIQSSKDKVAVIEDNKKLTYIQLWEKIEKLSKGLRNIGIKEGDNVAIILPSSVDFIISLFAIHKINAVAVPFEPVFTTSEYKGMFKECSPKAIITSSYIILKVLGYEESLLEDRKLIVIDDDSWIRQKYANVINFKELYEIGRLEKESVKFSSFEDCVSTIVYTYRGYGYPVGAMLTHENIYYGIMALVDMAKDAHNFLTVLPMAHIFGLLGSVLGPLFRGDTIVVLKSHSAKEVFRAIEKYEINFMIGVPTLLLYLIKRYNKNKHNLSSLKYCICGGNFLSSRVHKFIESRMGINIFQGYGLSEGLVVACNSLETGINKPGTLGFVRKGIKVKVIDENLSEVKTGTKGEIMVGGPTVMKGFYRREKETKEVLKDGWLLTGDYGSIDKDGYLHFSSLKKRIAKIGGHSIDLLEIEKIVNSHPCVLKTEAYAKTDLIWGQKVGVNVSLGRDVDEDEIIKYCSERLCFYKIPKKLKLSYRK